MKKILESMKKAVFSAPRSAKEDRQALERKATEGAKRAVSEYRDVFERLAAYDRS